MLVANLYLVIVVVIVLAVIAFAAIWIRRSAKAAQRDGEAANARRRLRGTDES